VMGGATSGIGRWRRKGGDGGAPESVA
jgi:hypothetical protein